MQKKISLFLRAFIGLGILFVLFKIVPYKELIYHLKRINLPLLIISLIFFMSLYLLGVLRWKIALKALSLDIKYKDLFFLFFGGLFFNLLFPSVIAQDVFRGGILSLKEGKSYKKIGASLVIDRFSGFLALSLVAIISFLFGGSLIKERTVSIAISLLVLAVVFTSLFIFSKFFFNTLILSFNKFPNFQKKLKEFHDYLYIFRKSPIFFLKVFFAAFIIQLSVPISFYLVALSFGIKLNILLFFILVPIIMTVATLPLTIGGLGTREATALYFFSKLGVEKSIALGISLVNFLFILILGILGGLLYLAFYNRRIQSYK